MNILILMACLAAGILIGRSGRLPFFVTDSMDRVLMVVIYALLLFVGIEVGTYSEVLQNLGTIGAKSVILCLGSIAGSGLLCMLVMGRG